MTASRDALPEEIAEANAEAKHTVLTLFLLACPTRYGVISRGRIAQNTNYQSLDAAKAVAHSNEASVETPAERKAGERGNEAHITGSPGDSRHFGIARVPRRWLVCSNQRQCFQTLRICFSSSSPIAKSYLRGISEVTVL